MIEGDGLVNWRERKKICASNRASEHGIWNIYTYLLVSSGGKRRSSNWLPHPTLDGSGALIDGSGVGWGGVD